MVIAAFRARCMLVTGATDSACPIFLASACAGSQSIGGGRAPAGIDPKGTCELHAGRGASCSRLLLTGLLFFPAALRGLVSGVAAALQPVAGTHSRLPAVSSESPFDVASLYCGAGFVADAVT